MAQAPIPLDTQAEVFEVLVVRFKSMSVAERVALVDQINADVEMMALIGIRATNPDLSEYGVRHELARRRFGRDLADEAYRHQRP